MSARALKPLRRSSSRVAPPMKPEAPVTRMRSDPVLATLSFLRARCPAGAVGCPTFRSSCPVQQPFIDGRCGPHDMCLREFGHRSEEHTSELQSLMRNSYAVFFLKKKKTK